MKFQLRVCKKKKFVIKFASMENEFFSPFTKIKN